MNALEKVDAMLSDRSAVPWESPSAELRGRVLAGVLGIASPRGRAPGWSRWGAVAAAAALIAVGWIGVYQLAPSPAPVSSSPLSLDPSPGVGQMVQEVSASVESSLTSEALEFLDHADRLTRNVVAQLPFTGSP